MLKADEKYAKKFFPNLIPSVECVSPLKMFRIYNYEGNRFLCVETKMSNGSIVDILNKASELGGTTINFEKHEFDKHNVYVGTVC